MGIQKRVANGRDWAQTPASRQAEVFGLKGSQIRAEGRDRHDRAFFPDAHGLLILAPEITLGSGWLGGDRVVGRAAIRNLLIKAARFNEHERQRLTTHLPSRGDYAPVGRN